MNEATLEFRGQRGSIGLAVATTPDWIHILSGRNEKVVRQEARRVLRKGRRFGTTAAYKAFTQVVNNGQFVVYVNMTAVTDHELRTLRAQKTWRRIASCSLDSHSRLGSDNSLLA